MSLFTYTFLESEFTREEVTKFLDQHEDINSWFYCLPNMIFIETHLTAKALSERLKEKFGKHRHFVSRIPKERWGILPKEHWELFPKNEG
jgi:hypothetical protein